MKPEYLKVPNAKVPVGRLMRVSSMLLFVEGIFLWLFWTAHEPPLGPGSLGVYSLFGIGHPQHNVFLVPRSSGTVILLFAGFNSVIILGAYRHGRKWSWYVLLLVYLALLSPPTIGAAISPGIGAEYYTEVQQSMTPGFTVGGGTGGPFFIEVSLLGVIIPWVLFIPGILLGLQLHSSPMSPRNQQT